MRNRTSVKSLMTQQAMQSIRFLKVSADLQKRVAIVLLKGRIDGQTVFTVQSAPQRPALLKMHQDYYRTANSYRTFPEALRQFHQLTNEAKLTLGVMVTENVPLNLSIPVDHLPEALTA